VSFDSESGRAEKTEEGAMIDLSYSLVIEATKDPEFFGFYSSDLKGFTGIGHSVEDCLYKAKWGMKEHVALLKEHGLTVPPPSDDPRIVIRNEKKSIKPRRRKASA
jgi:predicted RNase H-like HicB family nuclease